MAVSQATGESALLPQEHLETHFIWANPTQTFLFAVPSSGQDKVTAVMLMAIGKAVIASQSEAWVWLPSGIPLYLPGFAFVTLVTKLVLSVLVIKPFSPSFRE